MKPKSWITLSHSPVLRTLLCELDLDYLESKADVVNQIVANPLGSSSYNVRLIDEYWDRMTETEFQRRVKNEIDKLQNQVEDLENYLSVVFRR